LDHVSSDDPVVLVGTGLTAIDVAISLHASGHKDILSVSRRGLLPAAHPDSPLPAMTSRPTGPMTARSLVAWAGAAASEAGDWRPVIDALRPITNDIWCNLSQIEQTRLLRHVLRRWEVLRHRMAPPVASRIRSMIAAGELTVRGGGIRGVRANGGGIEVEMADRTLRARSVINCTGSSPDIRASSDPLVRRLMCRGVLAPGPLYLGLDVDIHGCVPSTRGVLWVVGPLRRGRLWETTAIPEIRAQAAALSTAMWTTKECDLRRTLYTTKSIGIMG
jgi:uncharacterized NAD(P)/FAD-binding protein YdhS